jgi:hypothetical protein
VADKEHNRPSFQRAPTAPIHTCGGFPQGRSCWPAGRRLPGHHGAGRCHVSRFSSGAVGSAAEAPGAALPGGRLRAPIKARVASGPHRQARFG